MTRRGTVRSLVAALWIAAILGLVALGTWQVVRRTWKLNLIAQVEARIYAAPVPAPETAGRDDAYRRVTATGRYVAGADSFVQASTVKGPGWWVLTPLVSDSGRTILVNRGYVPTRSAPPSPCFIRHPGLVPGSTVPQANRSQGAQNRGPRYKAGVTDREGAACNVTGLLRLTEPGGGFLRSNDPAADRWFSRDVAAIAARRGVTAVPYFIDADGSANAPGQPVGGLTIVSFPNNHLVYAITWYVLAMMTAAGFVYWIRRERAAP